jgi:hypothetical protein
MVIEMTTDDRFCPECGELNPPSTLYCLSCQARLPGIKEHTPRLQPSSDSASSAGSILFAATIGLIVAALGVFLLAKFLSDQILPFGLILIWAIPGTIGTLVVGLIYSNIRIGPSSGGFFGATAGIITILWLYFRGFEGIEAHGLTLLTFLNLSIDAYRSDRDIGI